MADDRRYEGVFMLAGFVLGSLTLGIVVYLIARTFGRGGQQLNGGGNPINIYNVSGQGGQFGMNPQALLPAGSPMSTRQLTNEMGLPDGISLGTKMETIMLNPVRTTRVFTVPRKGPMWRVRLEVIGPSGGYGLFAVDDPLALGPNSNLTIGAPQGIVVPAGGHTDVRIGPRQIIFGRGAGTEDDVQVSITASAEIV